MPNLSLRLRHSLEERLTLRCLRCRWVFTIGLSVTSPECPHCHSGTEYHEVKPEDFEPQGEAGSRIRSLAPPQVNPLGSPFPLRSTR